MSGEQKKLQELSEEYQALQNELEGVVTARQRLEAQEQENKGVQEEFSKLAEDANIYKLVGPVLMKQDKTEAKMAVDGRLEYIMKEIDRIEQQIKDIDERSDKKKMEIIQLRSQLQANAAAQPAS